MLEISADLLPRHQHFKEREVVSLHDQAIELANVGVMFADTCDPEFPLVLYVNAAFEQLTGYVREELLGLNACSMIASGDDVLAVEQVHQLLREHNAGTVVLNCRHKGGETWWCELSVSPLHDDSGQPTRAVCVFKDVSESIRQREQLAWSAHHDTLTGLPNRALLVDRMEQAIAVAGRHDRQVGVLFVDIDYFKRVNDTLGSAAGDLILREVASRLAGCMREGDTVARVGGDEFVLLLSEIESYGNVLDVVGRVMAVLRASINVTGEEIFLGASIGTSIFPRDGDDVNLLLRHADIAMTQAKESGRNAHQDFTEKMQFDVSVRVMLDSCLRKALERNEFELYYQPQVSLIDGEIIGAEALIRWHNPDLGMVSPAEFIPLAEETDLILPIGEWVLDTACAQAKAWVQQGFDLNSVAVNLSARQFRQKNLLQVIERSLTKYSLDALCLEVELTESMVMQDPERTVKILRVLKAMGVSISLDDFGTGYSSLSHLRRFPIDVLKVDQSFVREINNDPATAAIAASIVALAHNLHLNVVAEGVETSAQLQHMRELGCEVIQGYYFSKPIPAQEFTALLVSGKRI